VITKRFDVALHHAYDEGEGSLRLTAKVVTDHADHYVRGSVDKEGKVGKLYVDHGRVYTDEQSDKVAHLFIYYAPRIRQSFTEFLTAHNFADESKVDQLTAGPDGNIRRFVYEESDGLLHS